MADAHARTDAGKVWLAFVQSQRVGTLQKNFAGNLAVLMEEAFLAGYKAGVDHAREREGGR